MIAHDVTDSTLLEIAESIWTSVLSLSITPRNDPQCAQSARSLAVSVHIVGAWNGTVLFLPTDRFAARTASIMFDKPVDAISTDDTHDACSELCNIVAGALKGVLPGPSSLSLPTVTDGGDYEVRVRKSRPVLRLAFRCEGETLQVIVLQSEAEGFAD